MLLLAVEALQHDPEKQDTSWFGIGGEFLKNTALYTD